MQGYELYLLVDLRHWNLYNSSSERQCETQGLEAQISAAIPEEAHLLFSIGQYERQRSWAVSFADMVDSTPSPSPG